MLENYYRIIKQHQQLYHSPEEKVFGQFKNNIIKGNPNLNETEIFNLFEMNCKANEFGLIRLYKTKVFNIDDDLGIALEMTTNTFYNRHLPFDNMFFEYNLKVNKLNIIAFHILKDKWGTIIKCYFKQGGELGCQKIDFFDKYSNSKIEENKLLTNQREIMINSGIIQPLKENDEKIIKSFFCNFIDFLNTPDVEIVTVERTKEQNDKRILKGKLPMPTQKFIRVTGKLKIYLSELNSGKNFNYSHKFWVRGHFRTLRSDKWKSAKGTKIWIVPYIKGKGILIDKYYKVDKK